MAVKRTRKTVGAYELVDFPLFGLTSVKAKIDTGADSGALHCTVIKRLKTEDGTVLCFSPFDHPEVEVRERNFVTKRVKSSNGSVQDRYFITTEIVVQGKQYPIVLSLADRSEMKWPVLIGRRFLRRHSFLVDVRRGVRVSLAQKEDA